MSEHTAESDALLAAADDFEYEADVLARQGGGAEYVRGLLACIQALRERAESGCYTRVFPPEVGDSA